MQKTSYRLYRALQGGREAMMEGEILIGGVQVLGLLHTVLVKRGINIPTLYQALSVVIGLSMSDNE